MYPLFETIRYKNGVAENLLLHQQRVDHTIKQLGGSTAINLTNHIAMQLNKPFIDNIVYKCRIQYDLLGKVHIHFKPYTIRTIHRLAICDMGNNDYAHKYVNRNWINDMVANSTADDIILTQNGFIKDASYANLVFFNGSNWITPDQPLLRGTKRANLLQNGIISEAAIQINALTNFSVVKLVNAMMTWEESPVIKLNSILY